MMGASALIKRVRLSDSIVDYFQSMLKAGQLRPGDKLPAERELAENLGVSRTALREALHYLNVIGLVDIRHGEGTFIAKQGNTSYTRHIGSTLLLGKSDILDLIEARKVIETKTAGLSALRAQEDDIRRIADIMELMRSTKAEPEKFNQYDMDFHLEVAKTSRNSILISMLNTVSDLLVDQIKQVHKIPGVIDEACDYHHQILVAIQNRDSNLAERVMYRHLENAQEALLINYPKDALESKYST